MGDMHHPKKSKLKNNSNLCLTIIPDFGLARKLLHLLLELELELEGGLYDILMTGLVS